MPDHPSARQSILAVLTAAGLVGLLLGQDPAIADEVEEVANAAEGTARAAAPPAVPSTPTSDDDSEGHETEDPTPPDHASGSLLKAEIAGQEILVVGETESRIEDNGRARGRATPLRVLGFPFFEARSDSRGDQEQTTGPVDPVCDPLGPILCFALLEAHSESHEGSGESWGNSHVVLLFMCFFPEGDETFECESPLAVEVGFAESFIVRDHGSGETFAFQDSELINLCLFLGVDSLGGCGGFLGAIAAADAPSDSALGQAFRDSCLGSVENGDIFCLEDEPGSFCLDLFLCVFVNQGETFLFVGGAAARQEALHFALNLSEEVSFDVHLATAEVLARNFGVAAEEEEPAEAEAPALAVTGAQVWALVLAGLSLLAVGSALLAIRRRAIRDAAVA